VSPVRSSSSCCGPHPHPHSFPTRRSSDLLLGEPAQLADQEAFGLEGEGVAVEEVARDHHRVDLFAERQIDTSAEGVAHRLAQPRSEEHTSELQSRENLVCRLLLEKKKNNK